VLTLTGNAQTLVRDITARPEVPDGGGLRIAPAPSAEGLEVSLAAEPVPGDQVIDADGARVFVEPQVATLLDESTLDADPSGAGSGFVLTQPTDDVAE
jgi:Fe-S cluster assembly iron-binding protein IscA